MTKKQLLEYLETYADCQVDRPFKDDFTTYVARHKSNGKWFALVMDLKDGTAVNLKGVPEKSDFFRKMYNGVTAGYHMNKLHWNTVYLMSDVPDEVMYEMVSDSFELTSKKPPKPRKK